MVPIQYGGLCFCCVIARRQSDRSSRCRPEQKLRLDPANTWESAIVESSCGEPSGFRKPGAQGEKLHGFARVIFVGVVAGGDVGLAVVHHVQPVAHGRRQRNVVHDLPVVGECVLIEQTQPIGIAVGVADLIAADHPNVTERESDALPQLILRREIDDPVALLQRTEACFARGRVGIRGDGRGELGVQEILQTLNLNLVDDRGRGTESGLLREPGGRRGRNGDGPDDFCVQAIRRADPGSGLATSTATAPT